MFGDKKRKLLYMAITDSFYHSLGYANFSIEELEDTSLNTLIRKNNYLVDFKGDGNMYETNKLRTVYWAPWFNSVKPKLKELGVIKNTNEPYNIYIFENERKVNR